MDFEGSAISGVSDGGVQPESSNGAKREVQEKNDVITPSQILGDEYNVVVQHVAMLINRGVPLSVDQISALAQRYFLIEYGKESQNFYEANKEETPQTLKMLYNVNEEDPLTTYELPPGTLASYPGGLSSDEKNPFMVLLVDAIRLSDDPKIVELVKGMLRFEGPHDLREEQYTSEFASQLFSACLTSKQSQILLGGIADYIASVEQTYQYGLEPPTSVHLGLNKHMEIMYMANADCMNPLITAVLDTSSRDSQEKVLRVMSDTFGIARVLNSIRAYIDREDIKPEKKIEVERLGKWFIGLQNDTNPFHTSLRNVYKAVEFEDYHPNIASQQADVQRIAQVVRGNPHEVIVDLGCGTGRISNNLAREVPDIPLIIGLDTSPENLAKAQNGNETGRVQYRQADWLHTDLDPDSVGIVYSIGRSLTHAESLHGFRGILSEVSRILKGGGVFYFDMPDPDRGLYLEHRKKYLGNLMAIGCRFEDETHMLREVDTIVDSPDGKNFYNRYVPPLGVIRRELEIYGFEVEEVGRETIIEGDEAETVYFKATKKITPARQAPTERSLSVQFQGGE